MLAAIRRRFIIPLRLPVPVVVVGGVTVGGAGKTPLTLWLVEVLRAHGYVPGIVSRGYGGEAAGVVEVMLGSAAQTVGDEPLLLRQRADVPVFVGRDRAAAGCALLKAYPETNVVVCDDGLQHYWLARDVELAVLDRRGLGNAWCLPAGPLREAPARLTAVDALILNDAEAPQSAPGAVFAMQLTGDRFYRLDAPHTTTDVAALRGLKLHAVAGIGEPQRFFDHVAALGLNATPHAFPDHYRYAGGEFDWDADAILTTEKDAVKLRAISPPHCPIWVLPVTAKLLPAANGASLDRFILEKLNGLAPA